MYDSPEAEKFSVDVCARAQKCVGVILLVDRTFSQPNGVQASVSV